MLVESVEAKNLENVWEMGLLSLRGKCKRVVEGAARTTAHCTASESKVKPQGSHGE